MKFPQIEEKQVALFRADCMTGKVLDENFQVHQRGSNQVVYTIFQTVEEAIAYIQIMSLEFPKAEFGICDSKEKIISYYNPYTLWKPYPKF